MTKYGERIKEIRQRENLSQKELAKILYVSQTTISSWESNKHESDIIMLIKIANFFKVKTDYILGIIDDPNL